MRCLAKALLVVLTLAGMVACGGGGGVTNTQDTGIDVGGDMVVPDVPPIDAADVADVRDLQAEDACGENCAADVEPDVVVCPGGEGCSCIAAADCLSGFCVDTPEGRECSKMCEGDSGCKDGWKCVNTSAGADIVNVCVHPSPNLCRPCQDNEDCANALFPSAKNLCIEFGAEGSFCGVECAETADCPEGYQCVDLMVDRGLVKQCRPPAGEACVCTDRFKDAGYKTACSVVNEFGSCAGERACDTECSAKPAAAETCDGKDENCNGEVDEGVPSTECDMPANVYGSCKGKTKCIAGEELCQGQEAGPEVCNGIDDDCDGEIDEDSEDLDKDGIANCVDCDMDGDGIANENTGCPTPPVLDNCVGIPNQDQADTDGDLIGDACDCDVDADGLPNQNPGCPIVTGMDNCIFVKNAEQKDLDGDLIGDACDCDADGDTVGNVNPGCPTPEVVDNCTLVFNTDQADLNTNGIGDVCDCDMDSDGVANNAAGCTVVDKPDNCPTVANPAQKDQDKDNQGDLCDCDIDGDGVNNANPGCTPEVVDNCTTVPNIDQSNVDADDLGDACDCDIDDDGVPNNVLDICPVVANPDNCPYTSNPDQANTTGEQLGDACNQDWDNDSVPNGDDNCPRVPNAEQQDMDVDGPGDACDCDIDGDGYTNTNPECPTPTAEEKDNCALINNPGQEDMDGDLIGDVCDDDIDGDGDPNDSDCAPLDKFIYHGQREVCNSLDDNCNGLVDEVDAVGCTQRYYDEDGDSFGIDQKQCLCNPKGFYTALKAGDCADLDPDRNPGKIEICNGKDDDCDTPLPLVDEEGAEGCVVYYRDQDKDTFGLTDDKRCLCQPDTNAYYTTTTSGDCNDTDKTIYPGSIEVCNNKDDNCDKVIDEENAQGCTTFYLDADSDGYGVGSSPKCLCVAKDPYDATKLGDCDDNNPNVNPGPNVSEKCDTIGVDDNCNGQTDEDSAVNCVTYFLDNDRDGYGMGNGSFSKCKCAPVAPYDTLSIGDCNDNVKAIHPGAIEICNEGVDDNCNGASDEENAEGCKVYYYDTDFDGYGVYPDKKKCLCIPGSGYTALEGMDCNDGDKFIYPTAPERCNAKDDDCDTLTDEDYSDLGKACDGSDADLCKNGTFTCNLAQDGVRCANETIVDITEKCNGKDDDCDGKVDEDFVGAPYYLGVACDGPDADSCARGTWTCNAAGTSTECIGDTSGGSTIETCNGKDDDCDGQFDEDFKLSPYLLGQACDGADNDSCKDGQFICNAAGNNTVCSEPATGGKVEKCNGMDDDCDGLVDEDFPTKGQTCDGSDTDQCKNGTLTCKADGSGLECVNENPQNLIERCNGLDDDCDGLVDEDYPTKGQACDGADTDKCMYGTYTCKADGSAVECVNEAVTNLKETCNSLDDDCDGSVDEDSAASMCGNPPTGASSVTCSAGKCDVVCASGLVDVNNTFSDGCECPIEGTEAPNTCASATDLATIAAGTTKVVNGQIMSNEGAAADEDWFKFVVVDAADTGTMAAKGHDVHRVNVWIDSPSDKSIRINVKRGNCTTALACDTAPTTCTDPVNCTSSADAVRARWYVNFTDTTARKGEGDCVTAPASHTGGALWACCKTGECTAGSSPTACCGGANNTAGESDKCTDTKNVRYCLDDGSAYFVRVFRYTGTASVCSQNDYVMKIAPEANPPWTFP